MCSINSGRVGVLLAIDGVAEYERDDVVAASKRLPMPVLFARTSSRHGFGGSKCGNAVQKQE
jgi:hypothetical protein